MHNEQYSLNKPFNLFGFIKYGCNFAKVLASIYAVRTVVLIWMP